MLRFKARWQSLEHCGVILLFILSRVRQYIGSNLTNYLDGLKQKLETYYLKKYISVAAADFKDKGGEKSTQQEH